MVARADLEPAADPVYSIRLDQVTVAADRLRTLKPEQAAAIGVAMDADGQYDAIAVAQLPGREDYVLVDGLHRLEGARGVGWAVIDARIVTSNADARRRREILSSWARADHDVFDRAAQIKACATIAQADPAVVRPIMPRDLAEQTMIAATLSWDLQTAEVLGLSRRSVYNYLKIAETFDRLWVGRLRAIGHARQLVPLLLLAQQELKVVAKVIAWLEAGVAAERPATIAEGLAHVLGNAAPTPADKRFSAVIGNLARMESGERRGVINRIVAQYLTDDQLEALLAQRTRRAQRTGDDG